jgi:hypothetical protein
MEALTMAKTPCRHVGRETAAITHFLDDEGNPVAETWRFARWDRRVWVEFAEWAKSVLPDPQKETIRNIDAIMLKDAEFARKLKIQDHDELQRVTALNRAEQSRVDKHNEHERRLAEKEKRKPELIEPRMTPYFPLAGTQTELSESLVAKALAKSCSYLSFNSPESKSLLESLPGIGYVFYLLLKPNLPDMDPDLAFEIMSALPPEEHARVLTTARGETKALPKNAPAQGA